MAAVLPRPGDTPMPTPEAFAPPSRVMGAEASGAITAWSPTSRKPPNEVSAPGGMLTRIGPVLVEMATLAGTRIGSVSLTSSATIWPAWPTITIVVPVAPAALATASAWVTVLKLQLGVATPAAMPLPVAVASSPFMGSTKKVLPVAAAQPVQLLFTQQLPAVQTSLQQKSRLLAAQGPLALQAAVTQVPVLVCPVVVSQIVDDP